MVKDRATPIQTRSHAAREAIVAAVDPVVCAVGVDEASTNRIAEAAGVSVGTVYRYFPNKHALFEEYIERYRAELREQADIYLADDPDLTDINDVTRVMVVQTAEALRKYPAYAYFRLWKRPDSGELIAAPVREQGTGIIQYLLKNHPDIDTSGAALDRLTDMMIEVTLNLLGQAPTQGALRDDYVDDVVLMVTAFLDAKAAQGKKSG